MRQKMKVLESLQELDLRIDSHRGEREKLLREMEELDQKVEQAKAEIAGEQLAVDSIQQEKSALEEALAVESENIHRSEARVHEIKTQKEYQAVVKEIASAKKLKGELEEQVLQKLAGIEEVSSAISSKEELLQALSTNVEAQKSEVGERLTALDSEIAAAAAEREATVKGLAPSLLNRYAMLRDKRQGIAVVEARGGSCLGCNMNIPPQLYNNLYRGEEMISCPHCQRMLFLRREGEENQ